MSAAASEDVAMRPGGGVKQGGEGMPLIPSTQAKGGAEEDG
eukprot:CAMPEP_0197595324 /NCGR_PEP_ID=MMETSP1326-20131121/22600_1 /TAXON_ID=1155430 /ORGANISM="Genus nov. species nov., Strain RCC2288" /LENGTH=40 /DNA_ID= /DNA_START= /DNA_END= /DNA_ORIENTATION=